MVDGKHLDTLSLLLVAVFAISMFSLGDVTITGNAPKDSIKRIADVGPSNGRATVVIPEHAIEIKPNLFFLGTTIDKGKLVEGYAFVLPKEGKAKPGTECGNNICEKGENAKKCPQDCSGGGTETSKCFEFLARGAKWKTVEPWIVNPSNTEGLSDSFILSNLVSDISKWETAAGTDILGSGSTTTSTLVADTSSTDGQNEVYFANIANSGAIGVTIIWGIFRGPPGQRELVEWDQIYDDFDYDWSDSGLAGKMDFENIATHELGHSVGLGDLYNECIEETMYGFASLGETKKRTLEAGDKTGILNLYK